MSARRKKRTRLQIGSRSINPKILIAGGICAAALLGIWGIAEFAYLRPKREAEELARQKAEAEKYVLKGVNEEDLEEGNFYVHTGKKFYKVNPGALQIAENTKIIPDAADPENRLLAFGRDDTLTPTLYEDSTLVYKAAGNETIPSRFTIERFKDEGWTLGVLHLSDSAGNGKVRVSAVSRNFYPESSFTEIKAQQGDDITIDQIGGSPLTSDMLSSAGTIKDLQKDAYYQVDAYRGSDYIGLKTKADTHVLTSYEVYDVPYYSMDKANYITVKFPALLQNGYYYIQGKGCFKYARVPSSEKTDGLELNVPYYVGKTDDGPITNPVQGLEDTNTLSDAKTSYAWRYTIDLPENQKGLGIGITYTNVTGQTEEKKDETDPYLESVTNVKEDAADADLSTPQAVVEDPDGKLYKLDVKTFDQKDAASVDGKTWDEGILSMYTDSPKAGRWIVHMSGMYGRQYNVQVGTTPVNTDGTVTSNLQMRVEKDLKDGTFHFTWDNTDRTAVFEIKSPSGNTYSTADNSDMVTDQTYGALDFHIGEAEAGDWNVTVRGGNLGKIYYTYTDAPDSNLAGDEKDKNKNGSLSVRVDKDLQDGTFHIKWDQKDKNASFDLTSPSGKTYSTDGNPDMVTKQADGALDLHVGKVEAGDWSLTARGDSIGKISCTYTDNKGKDSNKKSEEVSKSKETAKEKTSSNNAESGDERFIPKLDPSGITPRGGMLIDGTIIDAAPADHKIDWK